MEAIKTRLLALLGALAILGWGLFYWSARRTPVERIVTKVEYRDRVVNKVTTQTETLPGGTVVKTVIQESSKEVIRSKSAETVRPNLTRYSLGLSVETSITRLDPIYRIELGHRLWESPAWATIGLEYQPRSRNVYDDLSVLVGLSLRW